ncbi:cGMP-dependent protein kinase, isozyme 1 [Tribolium castaneum]|uniref:cGMP-dependent protein kinase n=1 Tax=Tribolium castaneum TaxID=7070 RepID=D7EJR5_TRICA|nr:PREDICTED: cGMP-dependent protein kinase, isozyme 1 [Tribolium castaneum]EFA12840.1 cGMP-dependent protein kinase, isozyme 1-like Protein [Tribolium castaneum]|eukprot:XP_968718.1 PREDICTED: cGMP-dependent protein kinase, isozyme 1 [Tribolium castaneum]
MVESCPRSSMKQINNLMVEESYSLNLYPASVGALAMIGHAQQEPLEGARALFKKSHTCGSLYAKCGCSHDPPPPPVQPRAPEPPPSPSKRGSTPAIASIYPRADTKRLSNPEINNSSRHKTVIKANVYLNHPEITFPIPVELQDKPNLAKSLPTSIDLDEVKKSNLDYHKYNVLAYECSASKEEEAKKFLSDFGIFGPMGNGVATLRRSSKSSLDGDVIQQIRKNSRRLSGAHEENDYLKTIVARLKKDLAELEVKYGSLQSELYETRRQLTCKESEVLKLQREIHKLKSVLQQTTTFIQDGDILTSLQEKHAMANRAPQSQQSLTNSCVLKKQGVSAESSESTGQASDITIPKHDKDFRSKQLIKDAIMDNNFLQNLDTSQVREIVDCMYLKEYPQGSYVIKEGEAGAHLFVSAEGDFEVMKEDKVLGHMGPGKAFGELAILYNCTRTASIRVVVDSKVWVLDRKVFQQIMVRTGLQRLQDNINFLRSVPLLQNLSNEVLAKIADVLEVEFYPAGVYIIRQGANGDTFFIISSGSVKVTQRKQGSMEDEEEIRILQRGDYFGEQALLKEDCRTANIIAMNPGVECLTLDRESFKQLIGDLSEIKEKNYGDEQRLNRQINSTCAENSEYDYISLDDLEVIATLGIGGFGRVELVQYVHNPSLTFALKCLKKQHIVDTQQQDHIFSERNIMMSCRSSFICRMYKTFKDSKYVYMLLEACLGGEVWTILRDRGCFDEDTTKFITGCVLEAFDYLHSRGIIYRDLKPENLLLDANGYVKLVDFGFSKRLGYSSKTWTFCGTPEYVAPETILNKGHDRAVDYWALGILMHELLTGNPPFTASDPMKTYNLILKGIDMIDFAKHHIGRAAQSLIKKLCRDAPSERLGYQKGGIQDIKKHKWFQGFDWDGLVNQTLPSPIRQPVRGCCDTTNFDCFGKDNDIPPDELSNWDLEF